MEDNYCGDKGPIEGLGEFNELDDYQHYAMMTAKYPKETGLYYAALGLASEAGELCGKIKRILRDDASTLTEERRAEIAAEAGDVLWYIAAVAKEIGFPLSRIAEDNIIKLANRAKRGVISGSGDNR